MSLFFNAFEKCYYKETYLILITNFLFLLPLYFYFIYKLCFIFFKVALNTYVYVKVFFTCQIPIRSDTQSHTEYSILIFVVLLLILADLICVIWVSKTISESYRKVWMILRYRICRFLKVTHSIYCYTLKSLTLRCDTLKRVNKSTSYLIWLHCRVCN